MRILLFLGLAASLAPPFMATLAAEQRTELRPDRRGTRESIYDDGSLVEVRLYGFDAALLEDSLYASGKLEERRIYVRKDERLLRVEARDAGGALTGSLRYDYDIDGRLLSVVGDGSFGATAAGMLGGRVPPTASWTSTDGAVRVVRYDDLGRPVLAATTKDGTVVETRSSRYAGGPFPERTVVDDAATGETRSTDYDEKGRPRLLVVTKGSSELSRTEYRYDDSGRLIEERSRTGLHLQSRGIVYDAAGAVSREEYRLDGELERIVLQPGLDRTEELYSDGAMFVRVTFSGGRKVREEFFTDGVQSWSREYR